MELASFDPSVALGLSEASLYRQVCAYLEQPSAFSRSRPFMPSSANIPCAPRCLFLFLPRCSVLPRSRLLSHSCPFCRCRFKRAMQKTVRLVQLVREYQWSEEEAYFARRAVREQLPVGLHWVRAMIEREICVCGEETRE